MPAADERNRFIEKHYGLVHACCHRFTGRGVDYEDLFQAGSVGLIKAADAFDESRNVCFSTYAVPVILGEIKRIFRDGGTVKVGRTLKERSIKINAARERMLKKNGTEPTVSELASELALSEEEVIEAIGAAQPCLSLSAQGGDGEEETVDLPVNCDEEMFDRIAIGEIRQSLSDSEWQLIGLRYFKGKTQNETAVILGMTQVQVSRKERAILAALRKKFA